MYKCYRVCLYIREYTLLSFCHDMKYQVMCTWIQINVMQWYFMDTLWLSKERKYEQTW